MGLAERDRVLIVDDQQEMLDVLGERLHDLGKTVVPFTSGTA